MNLLCQIYRSSRQREMYLFVDRSRGLQDVSPALLARFGEPVPVMTLNLSPDRKLARANAGEVLASIEKQGFYLQMPPVSDAVGTRAGLENYQETNGAD